MDLGERIRRIRQGNPTRRDVLVVAGGGTGLLTLAGTLGCGIYHLLFGESEQTETPPPTPSEIVFLEQLQDEEPTLEATVEPTEVPPTETPEQEEAKYTPTAVPEDIVFAEDYEAVTLSVVRLKDITLEDFYLGNTEYDLVGELADRFELTREQYLGALIAAQNFYSDFGIPSLEETYDHLDYPDLVEEQIRARLEEDDLEGDFSLFDLDNSRTDCYVPLLIPMTPHHEPIFSQENFRPYKPRQSITVYDGREVVYKSSKSTILDLFRDYVHDPENIARKYSRRGFLVKIANSFI